MNAHIWQPSNKDSSNIMRFCRFLHAREGVNLDDFDKLHDFSITNAEKFWRNFWDFAAIKGKCQSCVVQDAEFMGDRRFFPQATLNFAENLMHRTGPETALWFFGEDQVETQTSWYDLHQHVAQMMGYFHAIGIKPSDVVGGVMPNMPQTIIAMLACTGLGAVWTSCSPDFGVEGIIDRFGQTAPKVLIGIDCYYYNGKIHDCRTKLAALSKAIPSVQHVVMVPYDDAGVDALPNTILWDEARKAHAPKAEFQQFPFDHPAFIMYSSGTTGKPKCIIHSGGGVLIKVLCEHILHGDLGPGETLFYFTTCGWMMWNWLAVGLGTGTRLVLYDGAPTYPTLDSLFAIAEKTKITSFGTSAKYIDVLRGAQIKPCAHYDLGAMRLLNSTGSPLVAESFDYIHQAIKPDLAIASMSGGTDILGCFVGGVPTKPLYRGEIQGPILGMDTKVFDGNGKEVRNEKGELVCASPFPS
ncbi:MAG: acetoacetate--CoA ligase, partial [Pseudomonadota bacterium]